MKTYNFGVKSAAWAASLAARGFSVVDRGERPGYPAKGHELQRFSVKVPGSTRRQAKRRFNALYWEAFEYVSTVNRGCGCCLRNVYRMRPKCGVPLGECSGENPLTGTELREERFACYGAGHDDGVCGECSGDGWTYRTRRMLTNPCTEDFFLKKQMTGEYLRSPHV